MTDQIPENNENFEETNETAVEEQPAEYTEAEPEASAVEAPAGEPESAPAKNAASEVVKKLGVKKLAIIAAVAVVLIAFFAFILPAITKGAAPASDVVTSEEDPSWTYVLEGGNAVIAGYEGSDVTVPETLDGHKVTAIGENALTGKSSITLPDTIREIRKDAFKGGYFSSIALPEGLTRIEELAFESCRYLSSIRIPASVREITGNPFAGCASLSTIRVASDYLAVMDGMLYSKADKRLICVPSAIQDQFAKTTKREATQEEIDAYNNGGSSSSGLFGQSSGTELEYDEAAGKYYKSETEYVCTVPDGVKAIGNYAFAACDRLERIALPGTVTAIGDYAFATCSGLKTLALPENLLSIGDYAFGACGSLDSIRIPNAVNRIGDNPFIGCKVGLKVEFAGDHKYLEADNDVIYTRSDKRLLYYPTSKTEEKLNVKDGTRLIGAGAFSGVGSSLKEINLPASVTEIGEGAFSGLSGLPAISLPENLTVIGDSAFAGCTALTSVTIPNKVTSIGETAFAGCSSLATLTIGNRVTAIGKSAFAECGALETVTLGTGVREIGENAFSGCGALKSLTLPAAVQTVGAGAFPSEVSLTVERGSKALADLADYNYTFRGVNAGDWLK